VTELEAGLLEKRSSFRPEIQALRAFAVALVLIFHLWPAQLSGGYIGVDIFFVISGYLMTRQLLREVEVTGSLSVSAFWARRARRLLPSSLLVLAISALASFAWAPVGLWKQFFRELVASTLYVQNWALARDAVDYFSANAVPSPVQHFWTLSVEEQFYFGLPLLFLLVLVLSPRSAPLTKRRALRVTIALAATSSFAYSLWWTASEPLTAYYSTATRVWEFGAGALLSFEPPAARPLARRCVAWSGFALCIGGVLVIDRQTAFPGAAALLPVLGAAGLIWAGDGGGRFEPARWARWRPVQFIADISYALYLWHWPLIVLLPLLLDRALGSADKSVIVGVSILLAWATTRWLENPVRTSWRHTPRSVAAWGLAGMSAVLTLGGIGLSSIHATERVSAAMRDAMQAGDPDCFGASVMQRGRAPCNTPELAGKLFPNPAVAAADEGNRSECWATSGEVDVHMCSLGQKTGYTRRVAALGDSHNNALLPAYEAMAKATTWRLDVAGKIGCYWTSAVQSKPTAEQVQECESWKQNLNRKLASEAPYDAIIVTQGASRSQPTATTPEEQQALIVRGLIDTWGTQTRRGTRIIALRDNPLATRGTPLCVTKYGLQANQFCALNRAEALSTFDGSISATESVPGSYLVDLSDYYCDRDKCLTVIGNVVVYRDADHITATFARTLAPFLLEEIQKILDRAG